MSDVKPKNWAELLEEAEAEREDLRKRYHEMMDLSARVDKTQKEKIAELQSRYDTSIRAEGEARNKIDALQKMVDSMHEWLDIHANHSITCELNDISAASRPRRSRKCTCSLDKIMSQLNHLHESALKEKTDAE